MEEQDIKQGQAGILTQDKFMCVARTMAALMLAQGLAWQPLYQMEVLTFTYVYTYIVFESYCNLVSNALIHSPPFSPPLEPRKQVAFPQQQLPSIHLGSDSTPSGSLVRLVSC
jgi:hypothetical protein